MEVKTYTNDDEQFYPTPKSLLDKITASFEMEQNYIGVGTKCRKR